METQKENSLLVVYKENPKRGLPCNSRGWHLLCVFSLRHAIAASKHWLPDRCLSL